MRLDYSQNLADILYKKEDPKQYLEELRSSRAKLFISKKNIELMKLNVYQMVDDVDNIYKEYEIIDKLKLSKSERLNYNSAKLNYFIRDKKYQEAKTILDEIAKDSENINSVESKKIFKECETIYRLNVLHDKTLKDDILQEINNIDDKNIIFVAYIRIAKLLFLNGEDKKEIDNYLNLAKNVCSNKQNLTVINNCLKDNRLLENI